MFHKKTLSLLLILAVAFIDTLGVGLVYPMFASMIYQGDCHILPPDTSEATRGACLGILLAAMPIVQFFSAPFLGMLSDKKGRKRILVPALFAGVIGYAIAILGIVFESFAILLVSRMLVGLSGGTAAVVSASLADISSQEDKAKNFGLFNMAFGLGFTAGPFIGGILSGVEFGIIKAYVLPFIFAGIVLLLNLIMIQLFYSETFKTNDKNNTPLSLLQGLHNIKKAFGIKELRITFLAIFFSCIGWSFYWEFTPVTWISLHQFDTATIGNLYAYGAFVYAISCGLLIRPIVNRFSNGAIFSGSLLILSISIGALLFHQEAKWLWFYIAIQQFAIALFWPTASAAISNAVDKSMQGEILGILQSVDSLAFAIGPLIAGPLLAFSASTPIVVGCGTIFLAAIILKKGIRTKSKAQAALPVTSVVKK